MSLVDSGTSTVLEFLEREYESRWFSHFLVSIPEPYSSLVDSGTSNIVLEYQMALITHLLTGPNHCSKCIMNGTQALWTRVPFNIKSTVSFKLFSISLSFQVHVRVRNWKHKLYCWVTICKSLSNVSVSIHQRAIHLTFGSNLFWPIDRGKVKCIFRFLCMS